MAEYSKRRGGCADAKGVANWVTADMRRPSQCRPKMSITELPLQAGAGGLVQMIDRRHHRRQVPNSSAGAVEQGGFAQASWTTARSAAMISDPAASTANRGGVLAAISEVEAFRGVKNKLQRFLSWAADETPPAAARSPSSPTDLAES